MDELLGKLSALIEEMDGKSIVLTLRGEGGASGELLQALREGKAYLRRTRAAFRRANYLMQKGYGMLVATEVP